MRAYGSTLAGGPVAGEGVPLPANTAPTGELEALRAPTPRAPATPWNRTARRTRAAGTCADCGATTLHGSERCRDCHEDRYDTARAERITEISRLRELGMDTTEIARAFGIQTGSLKDFLRHNGIGVTTS